MEHGWGSRNVETKSQRDPFSFDSRLFRRRAASASVPMKFSTTLRSNAIKARIASWYFMETDGKQPHPLPFHTPVFLSSVHRPLLVEILRCQAHEIELQLVAEPYAAGDTRDSSASDAEHQAD